MNFLHIRAADGGRRDAFEELCCQIFRHAPEATSTGTFRRIRGAGGDAGIEAYWQLNPNFIWAIQAKFFNSLGASEKTQIRRSIDRALATYPTIKRYTLCFPIGLTGKGAGGRKHGQIQKLERWITEWEALPPAKRRKLKIDWWDASELDARLQAIDPFGGRRRYWFDATILTSSWFTGRLEAAQQQAGNRYSPRLTVEVPAFEALEAFGRTDNWQRRVNDLAKKLDDRRKAWNEYPNRHHRDQAIPPFPEESKQEAGCLSQLASQLEESFLQLIESTTPNILDQATNAAEAALGSASECERLLFDALIREHGENADTPAFRQHMAEYNVSFPAALLDAARELKDVIVNVRDYLHGSSAHLPLSRIMLLRGPGGIGKTHAIVDHALSRGRRGLRSLVFFGEDFSVAEPWLTMLTKLGLGTTIGRDALFEMLDSAAGVTSNVLIIYVDALNETQPDRTKWQSWLPVLATEIAKYDNLKLCVSCRDTYLRDVADDWEKTPNVEHNGFAGQEFDAALKFFHYYGLDAPTTPLLQPEFGNPLFLQLVCQSAQAEGHQTLPLGEQGLSSIIGLFVRAKNHVIAKAIDYDERDNRAAKALTALVREMASTHRRDIPLDRSKEIIHSLYPSTHHSTSLLNQLERQSLIAVTPTTVNTFDESSYRVRFTFERVADHLLASFYLEDATHEKVQRSLFLPGGKLYFAVENDRAALENRGLLDALAMLLPEKFGVELPDVVSRLDRQKILLPALLENLVWRAPSAISSRTEYFVREALGSGSIARAAMESVLMLSPRPGTRLNGDFLHKLNNRGKMTARDAFWAYVLHNSFSDHGIVFRLIDWALHSDLRSLSSETVRLWTLVLAWFCASPDRRVRDRATKGIVRLLCEHTPISTTLLESFIKCDDDYVIERVLEAIYGALLLSKKHDCLKELSIKCHDMFFVGQIPLNALVRDHARLIIEYAIDLGIIERTKCSAHLRPPYTSDWPIVLPAEEELEPYIEDRTRFPYPMVMDQRVGLAVGTDFARYVVEPRTISAFDFASTELDRTGIFRWFLKQAIELGYPGPDDSCARYDHSILYRYGGGRSKPGWAERLGKKYYWIFLHRLVGQLADHLPRKEMWESDARTRSPASRLQGLDLRDIDPTDLRIYSGSDAASHEWKSAAPYLHTASRISDEKWVVNDDFPNLRSALIWKLPEGETEWVVIDEYAGWRSSLSQVDPLEYPYRMVTRSLSSAYVQIPELRRLVASLKANSFRVDLHGFDPHDYRGYLAEYPDRIPYRERRHEDGFLGTSEVLGVDVTPAIMQQLRGNEWEYDYSDDVRSQTLLVPHPGIIEHHSLAWDGRSGWIDRKGITRVREVRSADGEQRTLLVNRPHLESYISRSGLALVWFSYESKRVIHDLGARVFLGEIERRAAFVLNGGRIRCIGMSVNVRTPKAEKNESRNRTKHTRSTKSGPPGRSKNGRR